MQFYSVCLLLYGQFLNNESICTVAQCPNGLMMAHKPY